MGEDYSLLHAADLAMQLPAGSRVMGALNPEMKWDDKTRLLALIEYWLHGIVWSFSKDAKHNRNEPELHSPVKKKRKRDDILALDPEEYGRALEELHRRLG